MMKLSKLITIFILSLNIGIAAAATTSFKLDNGLKVILLPDHRSPIVHIQMWYKIGSGYEPNGITGISHALEHMMFNGTTKFPKYIESLSKLGNTNTNASTYVDWTYYKQTVPKSNLEKVLELEADRMQNLRFEEKTFKNEMAAVLEERKMRVDDSPISLARERFHAAAFVSNPYHHPVIGWEGDIKQYTIEDAKAWYNKWYAPNNAILVIGGDFQEQQIKNLIGQHFNSIPKKKLPAIKSKLAQKPLIEKHLEVALPVMADHLMIGFITPSIKQLEEKDHWQIYALEALSYALGLYEDGILVEKLKQKDKLVSQIGVSYSGTYLHNTLFMIDATLLPKAKLEKIASTIKNQLIKLKLRPISEERLTRIKNLIEADYIYNQDSIVQKTTTIGSLAALDLPINFLEDHVINIQKVTAKQIQQVAQLYFDNSITMLIHANGSRLTN